VVYFCSGANTDHVDIVMHDYRWRLGLADGERKYDDLEKRLNTNVDIDLCLSRWRQGQPGEQCCCTE
jgi:hypothetical protein